MGMISHACSCLILQASLRKHMIIMRNHLHASAYFVLACATLHKHIQLFAGLCMLCKFALEHDTGGFIFSTVYQKIAWCIER